VAGIYCSAVLFDIYIGPPHYKRACKVEVSTQPLLRGNNENQGQICPSQDLPDAHRLPGSSLEFDYVNP
jgi:hypothetical protein